MKVAAVLTDLMTYSRIESAAHASRVELARVDRPADAPSDADLVLVDWSDRRPGWTEALRAHAGRVILFRPAYRPRGARGRSERRLGADVGALEADGGPSRPPRARVNLRAQCRGSQRPTASSLGASPSVCLAVRRVAEPAADLRASVDGPWRTGTGRGARRVGSVRSGDVIAACARRAWLARGDHRGSDCANGCGLASRGRWGHQRRRGPATKPSPGTRPHSPVEAVYCARSRSPFRFARILRGTRLRHGRTRSGAADLSADAAGLTLSPPSSW